MYFGNHVENEVRAQKGRTEQMTEHKRDMTFRKLLGMKPRFRQPPPTDVRR